MPAGEPTRYSTKQILCGLRELWRSIGDTRFEDDTCLVEHMKEDGTWDETDFANVFYLLERFFGFECSREDWNRLFGVHVAVTPEEWESQFAPRLTFGALAQFIADRTPCVPFEPALWLDRPCAVAGVFLGIEQVAREIQPNGESFAPSTPVWDRFRGRALDKFWVRLRWISEDRLPALPNFWRGVRGWAFLTGAAAIGSGIIVSLLLENAVLSIASVPVALVVYAAASIYVHTVNPIPEGIQTFSDLARRFSDVA